MEKTRFTKISFLLLFSFWSYFAIGQCTTSENIAVPATPLNDNAIPTIIDLTSSIPAGSTIIDANFDLNINHTWVGDLDATLTSPDGTVINLFDRPGVPASTIGCDGANIAVSLSDGAANTSTDLENTCNATSPSIGGDFQPITPFATLAGESADGDWVLTIGDGAAGDSGTLLASSSLFVCYAAPGICVDAESPVLSAACPADIIIECSDPLPVAPVLMATDDCGFPGGGDLAFINEFHYDNTGGDVGEFIEIAGTAGTDLTGYSIILYNGNNGAPYSSTLNLSGIIPNESGGFGAIDFQANGLQNGAPDGFALVDPTGAVLEFLSYEGSFTATAGPANGMTSTDVGVSEPGGTPVGQSLQLTGAGAPGALTWVGPLTATPGSLNVGEALDVPSIPGPIEVTAVDVFVAGACANEGVITRTWTATDAAGNETSCSQLITLEDNTLPTFNVALPMDETTSCGVIPPAATLTAEDNCGGNVAPWVNEFHYDNTGGDVGEFIEIAGYAGTNLAGYQIVAYNGNGGTVFSTIGLVGVIPDEGMNYGAVSFDAAGLMNGSPDGFALVDPNGTVLEFWSYEGTFTATAGPANGMVSTDVGVSETSGTPVGQSLQLTGSGGMGTDFTWVGPAAESPGFLNVGQIITGNIPVVFTEVTVGDCASGSTVTRTWTATDACGNAAVHMQMITVQDLPPTPMCQNITVELDADGMASITPSQIDNGSSDDCGAVTLAIDISNFTCDDLGPNAVVLNVTDDCGNSASCTATVTIVDNLAPVLTCPGNQTIHLDPGACGQLLSYSVTALDNCETLGESVVQQDLGLPSGSEFPLGTTINTFSATDNFGNTSTCSWSVTIIEFVPSSDDLTCNNLANITLDAATCSATVGADQILLGNDYACYDTYDVLFDGGPNDGQPVVLGGADIGQTYNVQVVSPDGNVCWGSIFVEDKTIPELVCTDVTVACNESTAPGVVPFPVPAGVVVNPVGANTWTLLGFDPCGPATLTSSESEAGDLCGGTKSITRVWTVEDGSGNSNTCTQTINITPTTIADITADLPADITLECGATLPPVPTEIGCDNIGIGLQGDPIIIDICIGSFKEIRNFVVMDWCTNEFINHTQIIKVLDTQGPVLTCPANLTAGTASNNCTGSIIVPYPTWTDCSGGVTFTVAASAGDVDGNVLTNLPLGTHTITYTGTDACGNVSNCSTSITVADNLAPTPVCKEVTTVSISTDGTAYIDAASLDNGSHDNCGIVEMLARRMDNPDCPGFDGTIFAPTVPFSCCDVNTTVMVEFRVRDEAGNVNTCMVEVLVEDKINPTIACPGNAALNCDAAYLDDIILGQPLPAAAVAANGEAIGTDNCVATISNSVISKSIDCGAGTIVIAWTATDGQGLTASCIQQYTVTNNDPFFINAANENDPNDDVTWPVDYTATTCGTGLEPSDLSTPYNKPQIFEGACDNIAYGYWDIELTFGADDACLKILRKWYVVDWCQAQSNQDPTQAGPGVWHYTQVIKVINSNPPTVTCNLDSYPDVIENFSADCGATYVELISSATDDCTDESLLDFSWTLSNGTSGVGADASQDLENGSYTITFTVNDQCGNESICTRSFTVVDGKEPTPSCIFGIATVVMPSSGSVSIPVSTFENGGSSDNCTSYENLQFSFSQDVNDVNLIIECDDIPFNGMVPVTVYVTDEAGNFDFCTTFIQVDDTNGVCPDPNAYIQGVIENENEEAIQDVTVSLTDDIGMNLPIVTNEFGAFNFAMTFGDYEVTPEKDFNYLNGVTTYDLALISKHILGIELLDSPYKWIAADANHSETITALDIIKLRALILHIDDELADNTSWRFVDRDYIFQTANNPLADDFPEYVDLTGNTTYNPINFTAVKIGDVNGTAIANQLLGTDTRSFDGKLALQLAAEKVAKGETFTIDFRAKDFNNIAGYQFTLGFENAEFVDVTSNLEGLSIANFGLTKLSENAITTSWNAAKGVNIADDEILFSMTFIANADLNTADVISINSRYTASEAYNGTDLFDVVLEFNGTEITNGFELFQNTPNPFKAETSIGFNLPQAGEVTLKIMDASGRILRLIEMDAAKGFNSIPVDRASLDASGVLYYQLETATETATKMMIIVD